MYLLQILLKFYGKIDFRYVHSYLALLVFMEIENEKVVFLHIYHLVQRRRKIQRKFDDFQEPISQAISFKLVLM